MAAPSAPLLIVLAVNSQKRWFPAWAGALRDRGSRRWHPRAADALRDRFGPLGAVKWPLAFPTVNRFSMALLRGRAGRLTAKNGGFRPGQVGEGRAWSHCRWGGQSKVAVSAAAAAAAVAGGGGGGPSSVCVCVRKTFSCSLSYPWGDNSVSSCRSHTQ
jgi:hypothetical protein